MKKRILLTGVTGYLGSCLAHRLLQDGYDVVALKRKSSSIRRVRDIKDDITLVDVDDLDFDELFSTYDNILSIVHTATCYGRSDESVTDIFKANTSFPLELLDAGNRSGVENFINTDTILDKYLNLYSMSKNQLLQWGHFFSIHGKIRFLNIKLEHFYGPNDDPSKFTTYVLNSCLRNEIELKLTKGEQKRDFIYIDDVVSAYIVLLKNLINIKESFVEYEVGCGSSISIKNFVEIVHRLSLSRTLLNFGAIPYREGEVMNSEADITGLTALGWRCQYDILTGLEKVIEFEKEQS